jgi:preprotein translocase subunit SecD
VKRNRLVLPIVVILIVALTGVVWTITTSTKPQLGLDLQGGFSVVLQAKDVNGKAPPSDNVEKAKDIISQRVDGLGVAEPDITRQGRTVIVQLPGVKNRKKAESLVGCTARLEFRPVMSSAPARSSTTTTEPKSTTTTEPKTTTNGESGLRSPGAAPGEGAAPAQLV